MAAGSTLRLWNDIPVLSDATQTTAENSYGQDEIVGPVLYCTYVAVAVACGSRHVIHYII